MGAVPMVFALEGEAGNVMDFSAINSSRAGSAVNFTGNFTGEGLLNYAPITYARRLSGGAGNETRARSSFTWNGARKTVSLRVQGQSQCEREQPYDNCWGQHGTFTVEYASPPRPPPPSPPRPPPSPPAFPPSPPPPHRPRAFEVAVSVRVGASHLGALTVAQLSGAVGDATKGALSGAEQAEAAVASGVPA